MTDKIPCTKCSELILPSTAEKTGGVCMACKQGVRESIEKSKEYYRKLKEYDPYRELWISLVKREIENGFDSLTKEEKIYFSVNVFDREVCNGGMDQFFWNSSGNFYAEVIEGLQLLNAENSLLLLKQAAKILFGEINPPKDRSLRWQALKEHSESLDSTNPDWSNELEKIDNKYYTDPDSLDELLTKFAEINGLVQPFKKS
ncbi:MAG: DUF4375 domain-containing protein [Acidobacteriota bacterium]